MATSMPSEFGMGSGIARRVSLAVLACTWLALLASPALAADQDKRKSPAAAAEKAEADGRVPPDDQPSQPAARGQKKPAGWLMTINMPITDSTVSRVIRFANKAIERAQAEGVPPVLIFEFRVPPDQKDHGRDTDFSAALKLATYLVGDRFRGTGGNVSAATTIAFLPQTIQGHAVLAVMACERIAMASEAELGPAGVEEQVITPTIRSAYQDIANRRIRIPAAVAIKLVDSSKELLEVNTDVDQRYILSEDLDALKKERTISSTKTLVAAGQPGRFSGRELRNMSMIWRLAANRRELAAGLDLASEEIREDPLLSMDVRPIRVDLKGRIKADTVNQVIRLISDAQAKDGANFVCLRIESPGGSPTDSLRLADFLARLDSAQIYTVAYVPSQALADAALVAMACNQVVMRPQAVLGGEGDYVFNPDEIKLVRESLKTVAQARSRSWSLWAAMVDPNLEVARYTHEGEGRSVNYYLSGDELNDLPDRGKFQKGEAVTTPGKPFSVDGRQAVEYRLAHAVAGDFATFKQLYGLESDPTLVEPGWADFLIDALASWEMAILLLVIGGAALYIELHTPGIGIGGFLAAVCFALFFWSRFLGGTAGWLEIVLFVAGVCFLLVEVFVLPGFGIFGLGGGALILLSLVLASQTFGIPKNSYQFAQFQHTLLTLGGATLGIVGAILIINRYLPKTPLLGRIVLEPPTDEEAESISRREALVDFSGLLGMRGTTTTQLLPAGKALIANKLVDVMAEGEFIPRGVRIEVVEVHGNRVLVREVD